MSLGAQHAGGQWSDPQDAESLAAWNDLPSNAWDTVFSEPVVQEAIAGQSDFHLEQLTVVDDKGAAAAARIAVRRRYGVEVSGLPPFTPYSAIRCREALRDADVHLRTSALEELLRAIEDRFPAAALHLPPSVQDLRVFSWRSWQTQPLYTYRVRLDPSADPLESWSESARRIARQHAAEFEITEADPETQTRLLVESYERGGRRPPRATERLSEIVTRLAVSGLAETVGARSVDSGEIEASVTVLRVGSEAHYWLAGSKPGASMTVLLASLLPKLAGSGCRIFDFVGANTASIAEFKRRFGGQLTTYFRATWRRGLIGRLVATRV